jgi:hypothetical protein
MGITWQLVLLIVLIKALTGVGVGLVVTALLYRSRLTPGAFLRGVVLGAVGYFAGSSLSTWGASHAYFLNGKRMDQAPWGENLWLRNRLAENGLLLSLLLASIAVLIGYKISQKFCGPDSR